MTTIEETGPDKTVEPGKANSRPVLLSALCLGSFVYYGLMSLLFLSGLFGSGWISVVTNQYLPEGDTTKAQILFITASGFLLHGLAFSAILLIWKMKKTGYYLLGVSCLGIAGFQLLIPGAAIASTAVYIVFLLLFGLFYPRLR
jgi:hypothetical protein